MYDQSALVATENRILELLDWKLNCVTSYETMSMFLSYDINKDELMSHASLFLIFSLSNSSFVGYTPTVLGLASILCAFDNTGITPQFWTAWISQFMTLGVSPHTIFPLSSMYTLPDTFLFPLYVARGTRMRQNDAGLYDSTFSSTS